VHHSLAVQAPLGRARCSHPGRTSIRDFSAGPHWLRIADDAKICFHAASETIARKAPCIFRSGVIQDSIRSILTEVFRAHRLTRMSLGCNTRTALNFCARLKGSAEFVQRLIATRAIEAENKGIKTSRGGPGGLESTSAHPAVEPYRSAPNPWFEKMNALLVRIGIDQAYGGWNVPVEADGRFVYVPIPEQLGTSFHPGHERR
jgi:hypothetical protein